MDGGASFRKGVAVRRQVGSWKSPAAKLQRWRKTRDSPDNESRLELHPEIGAWYQYERSLHSWMLSQ